MTSTRSRPASNSTASSLMQDVSDVYQSHGSNADETPLSLSQALYARRAEYVRPKHVRIKIGTWNVAGHGGAERDVAGWFVEGKGVTEALAGLSVERESDSDTQESEVSEQPGLATRERADEQEARYSKTHSTIPKNDPGSIPGNGSVGLYVLGLQEMVDINSATEALRPYSDPTPANKWKDVMIKALPQGYQLVAEQQLIGLLLLVYASAEVAKEVRSISTTSVGTGLGGFMGNKGAVTVRIILGETTRLVFVNCHLSAGADKTALDRRNWDASQIVSRTRFDPIRDVMDLHQTTGEQLGDEDFAFWCGDLNYRLQGIPGDDVRRLLMLHTRNEYDLSQNSSRKIEKELNSATESVKRRVEARQSESSLESSAPATPTSSAQSSADFGANTESTEPSLLDEIEASDDPASLQTTLASLLPHDELHQQMKSRKAFYDGWREGPITFLPTYKYDIGSVGVFDSSEKKRAPSWCDRIIYRTRRDRLAYESKIKEEVTARKKDEEMKASGLDLAANDEEILYDYNPETDAADVNDDYDEYDDEGDGTVITREGYEDEISLEYYTAHQRVLSSDHKPLDAVFLLKYDAVVPELRAKIHAEVVRELDKTENESRPTVTVIVDKHHDGEDAHGDDDPTNFEGVWFGEVSWGRSTQRTLTVANTGRVPASFNLIERPAAIHEAAGIAPTWLNIKVNETSMESSSSSTVSVTLEPGDSSTVEVELRIFDIQTVRDLNEGTRSLDDILVLRVEGGRDHFIPVRARWLKSSLGHSIDKLIRIPEGGIRRLQRQNPDSKPGKQTPASEKPGSSGINSDENPVRFSAPRELFKLTEAIEELSTRMVAEWDMTHPSDPATTGPKREWAPWNEHPGWPFDEACWTEKNTSHFEAALSDVCDALDTDQQLDASMPPDLPRMQRLYVLANMLLLFLRSMPDGIITVDFWIQIETYASENEKTKRRPSVEEKRTMIQEILSQTPSRNISFILITSMLERMLQEVSSIDRAGSSGHNVDDAPLSPTRRAGGAIRRITLGKLQSVHSEDGGEPASAAIARVFADAIIRAPPSGTEKARAAQERKKAELLEMFLKKDEPG